MTSIQVADAANKEAARANRAREDETRRSNQAKEKETERSNKASEKARKTENWTKIIGSLNDIYKTGNGPGMKAADTFVSMMKNDPKWYEVSPQISKDVASIPTFQPTGSIPILDDALGKELDGVTSTLSVKEEGHRFATAGYCHFPYLPSIGTSLFTGNNSDGVNITAQNIYSFVRMHNSGSKNYERADYMMYLLAVDTPISYYAWMKRLYGLLNYANLYNKYLPRHLLNDMNVDYLDLSNNIANLRAYINMFAVRINASLAIPSNMPYYARHQFLSTYLFSDTKSKKHQLYFFSPAKYYIWRIDPANNATMLGLESPWDYTGATKLTLDDITRFGDYILETLLNQEDVGLMVGDTIKAFGEEQLAKVPEVPDGYVAEIGYSDEIMDQITNIKFIKKNIIGLAGRPATAGTHEISVVGYEPLNSTVAVTHNYSFGVYQNIATQQIYSPGVVYIKADFAYANTAVTSVWNHTNRDIEKALITNDTQNDVELNFVTDDTDPARVLVATRLSPTCDVKGIRIVRDSAGLIQNINAEYAITSCGSEVVTEGYTSVLYWDKANNEAKVATYELFDGVCEYAAGDGGIGYIGTPFTSNENFVSDFDYHPCINIYHTQPSGSIADADVNDYWIRRYAKLWDRNVSTHISITAMSRMHQAAIMGEFNLLGLGLNPRSKI